MSDFSDALREVCAKKDITIKWLADECEIDRTLLHKIIKGERKPPNEEFLRRMFVALKLTEKEKEQFIVDYKILVMGEKLYHQRKMVSDIIHDISSYNFENSKAISYKTEIDLGNVPQITTFSDEKEFIRNIQVVLSFDVQNDSAVKIIAQPSEKLENIMRYCIGSKAQCDVSHVFCLDNSGREENEVGYNIEVFPHVCNLAIGHQGYSPYYCYGNITSLLTPLHILSSSIITDNFVVSFNDDFSDGVIFKSRELVEFYTRIFECIKEKCIPFLSVKNDVMDILGYYYSDDDFVAQCDFQPCLGCALDEQMFARHARLPKEVISIVEISMLNSKKYFLNGKTVNLFTEEGVAFFMENGNITEIPQGFYTLPDMEERRTILRKVIEYTEKDLCLYRIIKDDYYKSSQNLQIEIKGKTLNVITRKNQNENFSYISITENDLVEAFSDYLLYLSQSEYVCSKEETLEILRKYV